MIKLISSIYVGLAMASFIFAQESTPCYKRKKICPQKYNDCRNLVAFDEESNTYLSKRDNSMLFSGTCISCYRNGVVQEQISIIDGKRNGQDTSYYNSGCPQSVQNFVLGKLNGTSVVFFDSTYRKEREITHINNVVDGKYILFENNPKNDTIYMEEYKNGKPNGVKIEYYENSKRAKIVRYKDGLLDGAHQTYAPNGKIEVDYYYRDGKKHGKWKIFYPDGKEARVEEWNNGLKNGEFRTSDEQGKIVNQAFFKKDIPEGKHIENYTDGKPKLVTVYVKGKKIEEYSFDDFGVRTDIIKLEEKKKKKSP
jgi:antitoxin component YwqK of YwqJK toxin-antitoxin module